MTGHESEINISAPQKTYEYYLGVHDAMENTPYGGYTPFRNINEVSSKDLDWTTINPEDRVGGSMQSGDPMADYQGNEKVQWGIAHEELLEKARDAASAEHPDADSLYRRAARARETSRNYVQAASGKAAVGKIVQFQHRGVITAIGRNPAAASAA